MRGMTYSTILWVDQLCINQGGLAEKSREVMHMSMIFRNASSVVLRLGEEEHNSTQTIELNRAINSTMDSYTPYQQPAIADYEDLGISLPGDDRWTNLWWFFNRAWFTRT